MIHLFLFLIDVSKQLENLFGKQVLERTPAGLTIFYIVAMGILIGFLVLTFIDEFRKPRFIFERDLPREVRRKLQIAVANRSIFVWHVFFILMAATVLGFHAYWAYVADDSNEEFQALLNRDLRGRRTAAANLRGWMLDRSGKLSSSLAYYKLDQNKSIVRAYALEKEMAHILGTERGTPGLERTLYRRVADPMPEAWEVLTRIKRPEEENRDVRVTLDRDLQQYVASQLEGKHGAIVVLDPQNGDLLAMYSNPSFNLAEARDLDQYLRMEANVRDKPLLNRATREFYTPGSTFKTFTMISAFRANKQNAVFPSYPGGFIPFRGSRPIVDATQSLNPDGSVGGSCDGGCQPKEIKFAYQVSSNQYFAQLAIELGRERLRETALAMGIAAVETPQESLITRFFPALWNTSDPRIANSLAPQQSALVTGKEITLFDLGIEGMGQGYASQITPFQMALIASIPANLQGNLIMPRIEADQPPRSFGQIVSPQAAATMRDIMSTVTEEPQGTGTVVASKLAGTGIRTGGKTGTAQKQAVAFDANGLPKTIKKRRRNAAGDWVEYTEKVFYERTDSWFICIAPIERPQIAIAVVVEGGGWGAKTAAPIAADVVRRAASLGLLGDQYRSKAPDRTPPTPTQRRARR